jgi:hypothetical protein
MMLITNYNNQYVKITSSYLQEVLSNPSSYDELQISANINCCVSNCNELSATENNITLGDTSWLADLTIPISLGSSIQQLYIQSLTTLEKFNVLNIPVSTNDTTSIKTAIDNWFIARGISSSVTVVLSVNTISIDDLPDYFRVYSLKYGSATPYTEILFSLSSLNSKSFLAADGLYISPEFFSSTTLKDGVYRFDLKFIKASNAGYVIESNCAFIDVTTKCKVATLLNDLKNEAISKNEDTSTIAHILHYALINGSNCGCNCDALCDVYKELYDLITNIEPVPDCGC